MKKTVFAAMSASFLFMSAANAAEFDGLYIGAGASSTAVNTDVQAGNVSVSLGEGSRALGYKIIAGYGKRVAQMYLAGELAYDGGDVQTGTLNTGTVSVSAKSRSVKSASLIVGFTPSRESLIYARIGKGVMDGQEIVNNNGVVTSSTSDIDVITKGVGFEYLVSHNVSLMTEVTFLDGDQTVSGVKYTVKGNTISAGVKSRF